MLHYDHLREASFSMDRQLKIIYHYHSGFSVQVGGTLLIFDYWEGEGRSLPQVGRITPSFLKAFEKIYVFISHAHPNHLPRIQRYARGHPGQTAGAAAGKGALA